ncbi:MAG: chromosomal replication initiator protein DnaA [Candidatus Fimenecus sp.]
MENNNKNWTNVINYIKTNSTPVAFETWFKPLILNKLDEKNETIYININSRNNKNADFILNLLKTRYSEMMNNAIKESFKKNYSIVYAIEENDSKDEDYDINEEYNTNFVKRFPDEYFLNPRYTFDSFVSGTNNEFAYNACLAVAESPSCIIDNMSKPYNPLFIYGGSGLGKTHLMHAIGNYIHETYPQLNCLYVSSEMFTNELIKAISDRKTPEFRNKYRTIDVLLIDDIQFLEGKDGTQDEFFYTFNSLYQANKQIIISSDRPPSKLLNIEERLRSRFQWNMTVDIQPADYENRVAILRKKLEMENIEITSDLEDVIKLISSKVKSNIRELEGAFTRVMSFSNLMNKPLNVSLTKDVLKDIISNTDIIISADLIKKTVSKSFDVKISDLESSKRTKNIVIPRQIAMYICREITDLSFPQIGTYFGNKDHSTVINAHQKISVLIKEDEKIKEKVNEIINTINDYRN